MEFSSSPFTSSDFQLLIDQNLSINEKESWCAGYLWWPIDTEFLNRYLGETGNYPFKLIYDGETVGHFNIWDDDKNDPGKIRVSRGLLYSAHRNRIKDGKGFCYWLAKEAISKAQELFPGKDIRIIVYDFSNNQWKNYANQGLSCFESAGFVEYERHIMNNSRGDQIATRINLEYDPSAG